MKTTQLLLLIAIIAVFIGCKKENIQVSNQDFDPNISIQNAQSWHDKSQKMNSKIKYGIKTEGEIIPLDLEILWKNAKSFKLNNGQELTGVPINIKNKNSRIKENFFLLISLENGKYKKTVIKDNKDYSLFESINSPTSIKNIFIQNTNLILLNNKTLSSKENKISNAPPPSELECFDYYWVEITYNENGTIVDYNETFLYTLCGTSGGGGGSGTGEPAINWGSPTSDLMSENESVDNSNPAQTIITRWYTWRFHSNGIVTMNSHERGKLTFKPDNTKKFIEFTHLSANTTGTPLTSGSIQLSEIDNLVSFNDNQATVLLIYNLKESRNGSGTTGGSTGNTRAYSASRTFNVNNAIVMID